MSYAINGRFFLGRYIVFSLLLSPIMVRAASSGNYTYSVSDSKAIITDFNENYAGTLFVTNVLGGYPVVSIRAGAFQGCSNITYVTLPNSITNLGDNCFQNCDRLSGVTFPAELKYLGRGAFQNCKALVNVDLPVELTLINSSAFEACESLQDITIPDSVTNIAMHAFYGCRNLTQINIPDSVVILGMLAFARCESLSTISLPSSLKTFSSSALSGCKSLKEIDIDDTNPYFLCMDGVLFNKDKSRIVQYPDAKEGAYTIPGTVRIIGTSAFGGCAYLSSVFVPEGVVEVSASAFLGCENMTAINMPSTVTNIGDNAFEHCSLLENINITQNVQNIGIEAFEGCSSLTAVSIPNSVSTIGESAFENCVALVQVSIGNGVKRINNATFRNCLSLNNLTFGSGVTVIGSYAFCNCDDLVSVSIGLSVVSIDEGAFAECDKLLSVTIPRSVTNIDLLAFQKASLTAFSVDENNTVYSSVDGVLLNKGKTSFLNCPNGRTGVYTLPASITNISAGAFAYCSRLSGIFLGQNVKTIGQNAFLYCENLEHYGVDELNPYFSELDGVLFNKNRTSLVKFPEHRTGHYVIPDGVCIIEDRAFLLAQVNYIEQPNSMFSIGDYAFAKCGHLGGVTIGGNVTNIGCDAFFECPKLGNLAIPDSVVTIDYGAFTRCLSLTSVIVGSSLAELHYDVFMSCSNLVSVYFRGNAPELDYYGEFNFLGSQATIYYLPGTSGWGATYAGRPTEVWDSSEVVTVTFDPQGGMVSPDTKKVTVGFIYGVLPLPTRSGFTFGGWWTGSGTQVSAASIVSQTLNHTLHAKWETLATLTVSFNPQSGTVIPASKNVMIGSAYGALPTPTRAGYVFAGWWTGEGGAGTQVTDTTLVTVALNHELYAKWAANALTVVVSFNPQSGTVTPASKSVTVGSAYGTLPTPTRAGYVFAGWWTGEGGAGTQVADTTLVTAAVNHELYANWITDALTVVVSFNPQSGTVTPVSKSVTVGLTYGTLPTPTRAGYSFASWWTGANGGGVQVLPDTLVTTTSNHTVYAKWTATAMTVTFDAQGGTVSPETKSVAIGSAYGVLPEPIRTGYTFGGWWTGVNGGGTQVSGTTLVTATADHLLYAKWTAAAMTVTFDPAGGTVTPMSKSVTVGAAYGALPDPIRTGHTFGGWWTEAGGAGARVTDTTAVSGTVSHTLYAKWTANEYTVTFEAEGGTVPSIGTKTVTFGSAYGVLATTVRVGYTFEGWWTGQKGAGVQVVEEALVSTAGTHKLFAKWKANDYVLSLEAEGGSVPHYRAVTVHYDDVYPELTKSIRTGYTFKGWWTGKNGAGVEIVTGAKVDIVDNLTVYACWKPDPSTVYFSTPKGTDANPGSKTVYYDQPYGDLPSSTRIGYTFLGWRTGQEGAGDPVTDTTVVKITENQTLYENWEPKVYKVRFDAQGGSLSNPGAEKEVEYGSVYGELPQPWRAGHTFEGWWTGLDGAGSLATKSTVMKSTSGFTLYAKWMQHLWCSPGFMNLTFEENHNIVDQTFKVGSCGTEKPSISISTDSSWVWTTPKWTDKFEQDVVMSFNTDCLAPGYYHAVITITDDNAPGVQEKIDVVLNITQKSALGTNYIQPYDFSVSPLTYDPEEEITSFQVRFKVLYHATYYKTETHEIEIFANVAEDDPFDNDLDLGLRQPFKREYRCNGSESGVTYDEIFGYFYFTVPLSKEDNDDSGDLEWMARITLTDNENSLTWNMKGKDLVSGLTTAVSREVSQTTSVFDDEGALTTLQLYENGGKTVDLMLASSRAHDLSLREAAIAEIPVSDLPEPASGRLSLAFVVTSATEIFEPAALLTVSHRDWFGNPKEEGRVFLYENDSWVLVDTDYRRGDPADRHDDIWLSRLTHGGVYVFCSTEAGDSDMDSLSDKWEIEQFSDVSAADETTDADGDGMLDRYEEDVGTDPRDPLSLGAHLSVGTAGEGTVSVSEGWFATGSNVVVTATPNDKWAFVGLTGDAKGCALAGSEIRIPMTQNRQLTAVFERLPEPIGTGGAVGMVFAAVLPDRFAGAANVSVKGLPAGLKYNTATRTIEGVPAKAGTFMAVITAAGGLSSKVIITVASLPDWAQGEFNGFFRDGGVATFVVGANGKVSGKFSLAGTNYTFSALSYAAGGSPETGFRVETLAKAGKVSLPLLLSVTQASSAQTMGVAEGQVGVSHMVLWRNVWKDTRMAATLIPYIGYYTATLLGNENYGSGYLTFTVDKTGKVKVAGKLADGTAVSLSGALLMDDSGHVFTAVYTAPTAYKGGLLFGAVHCDEPPVGGEGGILRLLDGMPFLWQSRNPVATSGYGDGFKRLLGLVGGWYSKTANLSGYYAGKTLSVAIAEDVAVPKWASGTLLVEAKCWNPSGAVLTTVFNTSRSLTGLTAPAADKPTDADKDGVWDYSAANTVGLKIGLTRATGVFKGSFLAWFDYPVKKHVSKSLKFEGVLTPEREDMTDGIEGRGFFLWPDKAVPPLPAKPYAFNWSYDFLLQE